MKKGQVSKRIKWTDTEPFPGNPLYEGRLAQMARRWGGYQHDLIHTPVIFDNSAGAFPDFPDDTLFVGDGCHRRELARRDKRLGEEFIAEVHKGLSRPEMYALREGGNDRRTVKPAETFLSRCERFENGVERKIKADVEGLGWYISYDRQDHGLPYTNELTWIWRKNRGAMLRAIQTYEAVWGTKPDKAQGRVLKGLGAFWLKYPDADFDRLVSSLRDVSVGDLYRSGKNQNDETTFIKSVYDGVRYSLAMGYNRHTRKDRLPL